MVEVGKFRRVFGHLRRCNPDQDQAGHSVQLRWIPLHRIQPGYQKLPVQVLPGGLQMGRMGRLGFVLGRLRRRNSNSSPLGSDTVELRRKKVCGVELGNEELQQPLLQSGLQMGWLDRVWLLRPFLRWRNPVQVEAGCRENEMRRACVQRTDYRH